VTTTIQATAGTTDVRLRVTSDAAGAVRIELRRSMAGTTSIVRAWPGFEGGWVHRDIDVLFNTPITYEAVLYSAAGAVVATATTGVVTVRHSTAIVRDALLPSLLMPLRLVGADAGDYTTDVRRELLRPWGRRGPIALTDVRSKASGSSKFLTLTAREQTTASRLLASGNILLFSGPFDFDLRWPFYISPGKVATARVGAALSEARLWTMEWDEVDPPPVTEPVPAVTWQQLLDQGRTWQDIRNTSWIDVMYPPLPPIDVMAR
jgi:hypothetical protein